MKRLVFIISFIICFNSFSQERITKEKAKIGKTISTLKKATGWILTEDEDWLSLKNTIPKPLSIAFQSLLTYENYGLGTDNFIDFKLKEITYKGNAYLILIKSERSGFYTYPSIKEDWNNTVSSHIYVFKREELEKFKNLSDGEYNLLKINLMDIYHLPYISGLGLNKVITSKLSFNNPGILEVHISPFKNKNIVQFYIGHKPFKYLEDKLKECYYETDFNNFNNFISLKQQ